MSDKAQRRGLGRGLGSLIPAAPRGEVAQGEDGTGPGRSHSLVAAGAAPGARSIAEATVAQRPRVDALDALGALSAVVSPGAEPRSQGLAQASDAPQLAAVDGAYFAELSVDVISPNPRQPRQVFDEESMAELVASIRGVGLLQPVVVRPVGEGRFELVMGERRWRATQLAGLDAIPAIVRETGDDALLRDALLENLHRVQLNPLEEAAAYQQLLDDFGCTHDELAGRIGRSRPQITNTVRLLKLSPPVQRRVAAGVLSAGHARALLAVSGAEAQDRLAGRVVAEGISVRGLEEIVAVGGAESGAAAGDRGRERGPTTTAPALDDLVERLSDLYDTRVKVDLGRRRGRMTIEFASLPDLQRIVGLMDPSYRRRTTDLPPSGPGDLTT